MASDGNRRLLIHYAVLSVVLIVSVFAFDSLFPELGFWVRLAFAIAVTLLYTFAVRALGVAPEQWQR